ncbi:type I toxin-antitoxin system Fst family toxin [Limosilactobacillus fermentum]
MSIFFSTVIAPIIVGIALSLFNYWLNNRR